MKINLDQLKEDEAGLLLPAKRDYDFEVIGAETKPNDKSTDGEMTKLVLKVVDEKGKSHKVKTCIGQWKNGGSKFMKTFYESVGLDLNADVEASELIGLTGSFHTKHGEFNGKPQVEVAWYIPQLPGTVKAVRPVQVADDDLPF